MNQAGTTQQGLIKHGSSYSTTGAHGMRAHNSNKTADHHVRHSIPPPLKSQSINNAQVQFSYKFSLSGGFHSRRG